MPDPVIITGAPRSGAGMLLDAVDACGAWRDRDNRIRDGVVRPFFRGLRASSSGVGTFPDIEKCKRVAQGIGPAWARLVRREIHEAGYRDGAWVYAGPDACLAWPAWHAAFPGARWILVRRDHEETITSCMTTRIVPEVRDRSWWRNWIAEYRKRFDEMTAAGLKIAEVWPRKFIDGDLTELREAITWSGLTWDDEDVAAVLSPAAWARGDFEPIALEAS